MGLKQDQAVFEDVAEAFRAAGGTLENLRLGQGTRGRGLFIINPPSRIVISVVPVRHCLEDRP